MAKALSINHVTLIVENLEEAAEFYEYELGMEPIPSFVFDYPTAFFKINEKQFYYIFKKVKSSSISFSELVNKLED